MYSELELDALRELVNIGSGTAATALSQMLGRTIDVSVPTAAAVPLAEAVDSVGEPELVVTGVALGIVGDLEALSVVLFREHDADRICELLGVEPGGEYAASALSEIGNILCSSYLGAFAQMTGLSMEPSPPQATTDMLGALVATVLSMSAADSDLALLLDSSLQIEGEDSSCIFLLVPNKAGIAELLNRLGIGA
jgi:chemotaxis protein CheC